MEPAIELIPFGDLENFHQNLYKISFFENLDVDTFDVLEIYYEIDPKIKTLSDPQTRIKRVKVIEKFFQTGNGLLSTKDLMPYLETFYILHDKLVVVYVGDFFNYTNISKLCSGSLIVVKRIQ